MIYDSEGTPPLQAMQARIAELECELRSANEAIDGYGKDEPPIVKGALDAQAEAERKSFALRKERDALKADAERLRARHGEALARATAAEAAVERLHERLRVATEPGAWAWSDDEAENDLASMGAGMVVRITAAQLRALLRARQAEPT